MPLVVGVANPYFLKERRKQIKNIICYDTTVFLFSYLTSVTLNMYACQNSAYFKDFLESVSYLDRSNQLSINKINLLSFFRKLELCCCILFLLMNSAVGILPVMTNRYGSKRQNYNIWCVGIIMCEIEHST